MIINGEKVPAFSATTLSIPTTPKDNFDAIIASSREKYSRPRSVVEAEIKETIEQSEKYKKELSDSGRAAGEIGAAMNPQIIRKLKMSPDMAEGKTDRPGLKDLGKLLAQAETSTSDKQIEQGNTPKMLFSNTNDASKQTPEAHEKPQNTHKNHNRYHNKPYYKNKPKNHSKTSES